MICRNCGTEIADKAIVCYRCGTGTKDPVRKPAAIRRKGPPLLVLIVLVVAILIALYVAWNAGVFGLEVTLLREAWSSAVLIDFGTAHA